jgi:hypothetical protein
MKNLLSALFTALVLSAGGTGAAHAADTLPAQQLAHWSAQAGAPGNAPRGQTFFNTKHGGEWSCASCHGTSPTAEGTHASTGKPIAPMAPAFNPKAFTDTAKVDKWFRRNCKDVLARECSAGEKADVLAYLNSLK